jgi:hypothetical protein
MDTRVKPAYDTSVFDRCDRSLQIRFSKSLVVIASQRVARNARPMTGSAKQSIAPQKESWIASSQVLLAMT